MLVITPVIVMPAVFVLILAVAVNLDRMESSKELPDSFTQRLQTISGHGSLTSPFGRLSTKFLSYATKRLLVDLR